RIGEIRKPARLALLKSIDGSVSIRATDTVDSPRFKAPKNIGKMPIQIRKMLDHVMRIHASDCFLSERQRISQVDPNVTLAGEHVGVQVDPSIQIFLLTRPELNSHVTMTRSS